MSFTEQEKELLSKYVTSSEDDVFAVHGMQGMVGAAYARYSRAKGGFRETLLNEFIKEGVINPQHANELIERILIAYGDDSVGELEGAHVSFENISMVATKEIEDRRIGGSPIEQSTRYVFYDQKTESGSWRYLRTPELLETPFGKLYEDTMNSLFESYVSLIEPMKEYFNTLTPLEKAAYDINGDGTKENYSDLHDEKQQKAFRTTYTIDLRAKACDSLRALLPLATLTNVGVFGNGRFFQGLISHLLTSNIPEANRLAKKTLHATQQIIPQYVRRAVRSEYLASLQITLQEKAKIFDETPETTNQPIVTLLPREEYFESMLSAIYFPHTNISLEKLRRKISVLKDEEKQKLLEAAIGKRKTRRDRPGRGFEDGYPLTFDLVTNWGVYKDVMRHRMTSQERQLFTTKIGFDMPPHVKAAGFEEKVKECVRKCDILFDAIKAHSPLLAQYAVMHGHFTRWTLAMNAREAFHLLELRSTPQGHSQYRLLAQMMHKEIARMYPWLAPLMSFVDHASYESARGDSEARQRRKEQELEERLNKYSTS